MTPAALGAFLSGDEENFLVASMPGGIERQEKQGQMKQAQLQTLPVDGTSKEEERKQWESLGFKFKVDRVTAQNQGRDEIFVECEFPEGWKKVPTDHSMWTDIVDANGRKRASIFYKAAFYDRSAHCHLERRFHVSEDYDIKPHPVLIRDACGQVEKKIEGLPDPDWNNREEALKRSDRKEAARKELAEWLKANYPDCESPLAYWD